MASPYSLSRAIKSATKFQLIIDSQAAVSRLSPSGSARRFEAMRHEKDTLFGSGLKPVLAHCRQSALQSSKWPRD